MKILFISYFFDPYPGVGAKRISYWADEILNYGIEPTVITTIEQKEKKEYPVYCVPNTKRKRILSSFIKDKGYSWELDLIDFLKKNELPQFDFVLISGGPFMHMGISSSLKKQFPKAKIILDFRDPFGINPRYKESFLKSAIKKYFDRKFCKSADYIITVNEFCKKLIQTDKDIEVIDNGFDERVIKTYPEQKNREDFLITHAGSLYNDRDPRIFLELLNQDSNRIKFEQYGNDTPFFYAYRKSSFFNYKGKFPYNELIEQLNNADACVLFTLGKAFESTTKVFDYIALNKRILIITEGEPKTGNLNEITKDYPNVVWAKNNENAIREAIGIIREIEVRPFDSSIYSRKNSLNHLVKLLKSI